MPLNPGQLEDYRSNGYVLLCGIIDALTIRRLQSECDRLAADDAVMGRGVPGVAPRATVEGGTAYDRLDPVLCHSEEFRRIATDERIHSLGRSVLNDDVHLLKDKLILKPPGTTGYGLHQDLPYWDYLGVPGNAVCSALLAIDPATEANGALQVLPGLQATRLPAPASDPRDVDESQVDMTRAVLVAMEPGDVLLFHSLTPHFSGPNQSRGSRRSLFLTMNSAACGNVYDRYQSERQKHLTGDLR